jgi:hypothetical protein
MFGGNGFVFGANLPWVHYGLDFGANTWRPSGGLGCDDDSGSRENVSRELAVLADSGVQVLRWFLFCDGRAGIRFDSGGRPIGIDDFVFRDIDAALTLVAGAGMTVMFTLLDFHWCRPARMIGDVQLGGRANILRDRSASAELLDNVFRPVLERYGQSSTIFAWDVMNEPEWVERDRLRPFIEDAISVIRSCAAQPITVGCAGVKWGRWYRDMDVDFYQVHWYPAHEGPHRLDTPVEQLGFDRPVILGEFPTRGSRRSGQAIVESARAAGYAGAFYWSALANDACTDRSGRPVCKAGSFSQLQSSAKWWRP